MARSSTGKITVRTVEKVQKNGDIYVIEEQRQYNQEKKYTVTISSKLIGLKTSKDGKIINTRPRRKFVDMSVEKKSPTGEVTVTKKHVQMMDIIDHMAKKSGVDDDVYVATDEPTAKKILSMARYIICTDAHTLAGVEEWQYNHPLPYEDGINKGIYHDLFTEIGKDATLQQSFFKSRLDREGEVGIYLAFDSSTSSSCSVLLEKSGLLRYGFNKDDDGMATIKYLVLFSLKTKMPIWFTKLPGNIPDVITIKQVLNELKALGVNKVTLVSDNGYYSESNIGEMLWQGFDFITLGNSDVLWARNELDKILTSLKNPARCCPFDLDIHGVTVPVKRTFEWTRTYASQSKGLKAGDKDNITKTVYLHFFFSSQRKVNEDAALKRIIMEAKAEIEQGISIDTLKKPVRDLVKKCCDITYDKAGNAKVIFTDEGFEDACKYHGIFMIVTNRNNGTFDTLSWYRKREEIEDFFRRAKQDACMRHVAVWSDEALQGRMFVQFVALCIYQYTENEIFRVKDECESEKMADGKKKNKTVMDSDKKLFNWIDSRSIVRILNWFDAYEQTTVSEKLKRKRWSSPQTARDKLFLGKLGVIPQDKAS